MPLIGVSSSDPLPEHVVLLNLDRELATAGIDVDASPYPGGGKNMFWPRQAEKKEAQSKRVQGMASIYRIRDTYNTYTYRYPHHREPRKDTQPWPYISGEVLTSGAVNTQTSKSVQHIPSHVGQVYHLQIDHLQIDLLQIDNLQNRSSRS